MIFFIFFGNIWMKEPKSSLKITSINVNDFVKIILWDPKVVFIFYIFINNWRFIQGPLLNTFTWIRRMLGSLHHHCYPRIKLGVGPEDSFGFSPRNPSLKVSSPNLGRGHCSFRPPLIRRSTVCTLAKTPSLNGITADPQKSSSGFLFNTAFSDSKVFLYLFCVFFLIRWSGVDIDSTRTIRVEWEELVHGLRGRAFDRKRRRRSHWSREENQHYAHWRHIHFLAHPRPNDSHACHDSAPFQEGKKKSYP